MTEPSRLGDHLEPALSPARLARNRAAIEARLATGRSRWWSAALVGGTLAAAAAVVTVAWPPAETAPTALGSTVWPVSTGARVAAADEATTVTLDDGSVVALEPHTSVRGAARSAGDIALEVEHGEAHFDVAHDDARTFRVVSGDVEVRVIGTAFSVAREAGRVNVVVARGRVEVRRGGVTSVLGPGDRWGGDEWVSDDETDVEPAPVAPEPAGEEASLSRPRARDIGRSLAREPADDGRAEGADAEDARALFSAAQAARRGGRPDHAAALFAELVAQHPDDPRAGLAAFELGRIRLDVMHDTRGSIEALERALALSPRGGFREDALARLVVLYDRTGAHARCREARSRYLADHPDGVHATEVGSLCD
jgi:transmembrane sensor